MPKIIANLLLAAGGALSAPVATDTFPLVTADIKNAYTVFDWGRDHCATWDVPDAPLRAFRRHDGQVVAFASSDTSQPLIGASLLSIRHGCHSSLHSGRDPDPSHYDGDRFLASTWTADGTDVFGLAHDEHHADRFHRCARTTALACWYNTVIAVTSHDGGDEFVAAQPPSVVAGGPMTEDAEPFRHRGFFNPSNILYVAPYWFVMSNTTGFGAQKAGLCLFRSDDIADPSRWRGWDGAGFDARTIDPYRDDAASYGPCQPVDHLATIGSISRYEKNGRYLAVAQGPDANHPNGQISLAWSSDLIHWSVPRTLLDVSDMSSQNCADKVRYGYPSLADPKATGRNFDVVGDDPVLFLTRFHIVDCHMPPERDLVRIPVHIDALAGWP